MKRPDNFSLAHSVQRICLLLTCLTLWSTSTMAKTTDIGQALHIEADAVEIREQQGISIYTGHVTIHRGTMFLKGDLVKITTKENDIYIINIDGKPARFKQVNDNDIEVSAQSQHMSFSSETGILTMHKEAILVQGVNQFTSEHIVYNTQKDIVQAGKSVNNDTTTKSKKPERVSITIQPKQEQDTAHEKP